VTSDFYTILGVSPSAENVVIRAAYRALMRHYHPDTNPDPEAQRKAQEITAAFAVLRDPARRAEYDASLRNLSGEEWWYFGEETPRPTAKPPAMRGWALASAALALVLVVAVWARPQAQPSKAHVTAPARHVPAATSGPIVELEPESDRLARLRGDSEAVPAPPVLPPINQALPVEPPSSPIISAPAPRAEPIPVAATAPKHAPAKTLTPAPARVASAKPKAAAAPAEVSEGCRPGGEIGVSIGCKNARIVALDRAAAGFFSQSMARADAAKRQLLLSSHTRSAEMRVACHSDSCVSDAYLRQIREISAIMKEHSPAAN
jgi:hypothetical protein